MDIDDFDRLYAEHADSVFSFLAYRTGDRALADDLLADTFERVLRSRRRFRLRRQSEKSWLYTIAVNLLRDHFRRQQVERRAIERLSAVPEEESSSGGVLRVETLQSLAGALATLSVAETEAIALRFGADLTLREIADVTGTPLSTVESRINRALEKLREVLQ